MKKTFKAVLKEAGRGGVFVDFPYDTQKLYGLKGMVKISATIDGEPYCGSLAKMGGPRHRLLVLKAIREKIAKGAGDSVSVTIEQDWGQRIVIVPKELKSVLSQDKVAAAFFATPFYTHQKKYAKWVGEAKLAPTRVARAQKALSLMIQDKKERYG